MSKSIAFFVFSFLTAFLFSCTQKGSGVLSSHDVQSILESKKGASDTLEFWSMKESGNQAILVGVYQEPENAHITVLQASPDRKTWSSLSTDSLVDARTLNRTEWTSVNGHLYLYIEYAVPRDKAYADLHKKSQKGLYEDIYFKLFDPFATRMISLRFFLYNSSGKYEPDPDHSQGKFDKKDVDSLKKESSLLSFLQRKVSVSSLIPEEIRRGGLPTADSVLKKWAMLNDGVYDALFDPDSKILRLNIEEYNTDILPGLSDYGNDTAAFKADITSVENGVYKIESKVKGPVYVLNKNSKKTFLAWAPPNNEAYAGKLKLRSGDVLWLWPAVLDSASSEKPVIEINLTEKTIRRVKDTDNGKAKDKGKAKDNTKRNESSKVKEKAQKKGKSKKEGKVKNRGRHKRRR